LRVTEAPLDLAECFNADTNTCKLIGVCALSCLIRDALKGFLAILDNSTIADISRNKDALAGRLGLTLET
jgi:Rrf2 family transcriptional regulator, nitric oxide-sensitive transcriptional repressor